MQKVISGLNLMEKLKDAGICVPDLTKSMRINITAQSAPTITYEVYIGEEDAEIITKTLQESLKG